MDFRKAFESPSLPSSPHVPLRLPPKFEDEPREYVVYGVRQVHPNSIYMKALVSKPEDVEDAKVLQRSKGKKKRKVVSNQPSGMVHCRKAWINQEQVHQSCIDTFLREGKPRWEKLIEDMRRKESDGLERISMKTEESEKKPAKQKSKTLPERTLRPRKGVLKSLTIFPK